MPHERGGESEDKNKSPLTRSRMFFSGPPSQRPLPQRAPAPPVEEETSSGYFVDFGATFAEEMEKLLRLRRQGMLCEIVFWQDAGYGF